MCCTYLHDLSVNYQSTVYQNRNRPFTKYALDKYSTKMTYMYKTHLSFNTSKFNNMFILTMFYCLSMLYAYKNQN